MADVMASLPIAVDIITFQATPIINYSIPFENGGSWFLRTYQLMSATTMVTIDKGGLSSLSNDTMPNFVDAAIKSSLVNLI